MDAGLKRFNGNVRRRRKMMNRKTQVTTASCLLGGAIILIGAVMYLGFVFPKTIAVWADQGRHPNTAEMFVVNVSNLVRVFGFPILGMLMLAIVASLVWLAVSAHSKREDAANQQIRPIAGKPCSG
jgi:type II secretory pathway component PulF